MDDDQIIALYFARDEAALTHTAERYGAYCAAVSSRILADARDVDECVNAAWLAAWNSIPPQRPEHLKLYLAKLVRRISLSALRQQTAQKRVQPQMQLALDELADCLPAAECVESRVADALLAESIQHFLRRLPDAERQAFLLRYWHFYSVTAIAETMRCTPSKIGTMLFRTRIKLKNHLLKEELL